MKRLTKRFLSGLLALAVVLMLVPVLAPQTAYAASATITIDNNGTLQSWQNTIQNAINSAGSGDTVTVNGSRTDVSLGMNLSVKQGVNLVWQADLSGHTSTSYHILSVTTAQGGTFEVAGCTISNSGSGVALGVEGSCTLSGGAVKNTGTGLAIAVYPTGSGFQSNLLVKGTAKVSSSSYVAISTRGNNNSITISENADISSGGEGCIRSICFDSNSNSITGTGGTIQNTHSGGSAISSDGNINVSGGTISTTNTGIIGFLPNG
ncbi:MAG: hypothetical protein PHG57_07045, partial [Eubacteriales bacterium]|nr:hypothetical protein [Eubacteriales bacterium]